MKTTSLAVMRKRELRLAKMKAYLDQACAQMRIDAKYLAKATELLPKASMIGTKEYRGWSGSFVAGMPIEAIVDALIYAVIIDESGLACSLIARKLHVHKKQHPLKLVREVRRATGLHGKVFPVLPRKAIEVLGLQADEVEDIKAIIDDPHFQGWVGPSPASISAAITYLYLLQRRLFKASQYDVAHAFGITDVCLRKRAKEIMAEVPCEWHYEKKETWRWS